MPEPDYFADETPNLASAPVAGPSAQHSRREPVWGKRHLLIPLAGLIAYFITDYQMNRPVWITKLPTGSFAADLQFDPYADQLVTLVETEKKLDLVSLSRSTGRIISRQPMNIALYYPQVVPTKSEYLIEGLDPNNRQSTILHKVDRASGKITWSHQAGPNAPGKQWATFSPKGTFYIRWDRNGTGVTIYRCDNHQQVWTSPPQTRALAGVRIEWSPDERYLVAVSTRIDVVDVPAGKIIAKLRGVWLDVYHGDRPLIYPNQYWVSNHELIYPDPTRQEHPFAYKISRGLGPLYAKLTIQEDGASKTATDLQSIEHFSTGSTTMRKNRKLADQSQLTISYHDVENNGPGAGLRALIEQTGNRIGLRWSLNPAVTIERRQQSGTRGSARVRLQDIGQLRFDQNYDQVASVDSSASVITLNSLKLLGLVRRNLAWILTFAISAGTFVVIGLIDRVLTRRKSAQ